MHALEDVTLESLPGHDWIRRVVMPNPGGGEAGPVNCWLLGSGDDLALIDTGMDSEETRQRWLGLFAGPLAGARIRTVLCTHGHPDHAGLADWLASSQGCPLIMTAPERALARLYSAGSATRAQARRDMLRLAGFPSDGLSPYNPLPQDAPRQPEVMATSVGDGQQIVLGGKSWRVLVGGGHSPSAISLLAEDNSVVVVGDEILPHMTPFVGINAVDLNANPVSAYLNFLARSTHLLSHTLALPGHAEPFRGVPSRAADLAAKIKVRSERILTAASPRSTCADLIKVMFRGSPSSGNFFIYLSVAIASLNHLVGEGQLIRTTREDGTWIFDPA